MKELKLKKAIRMAFVPVACASLLAACTTYDPRASAPVYSSTAAVEVVENNPYVLFERLDTNRDGFLSVVELEPLRLSERALAPETAATAFHRLDIDRDGFLNRVEAAAMLASVPGARFELIDTNRDGFLSMGEAEPHLRYVESRDPQVRWLATFDVNRDGLLSRNEAEPLLRATRFVGGRYEVGPIVATTVSFDTLDTDRSGFLNRPEAAVVLATPYDFDRFDTNRDGYLSRAEADVMFRAGVGATVSPAIGTVPGPRY